jgi:hypothetical protein
MKGSEAKDAHTSASTSEMILTTCVQPAVPPVPPVFSPGCGLGRAAEQHSRAAQPGLWAGEGSGAGSSEGREGLQGKLVVAMGWQVSPQSASARTANLVCHIDADKVLGLLES